jgi:hypothetical protein
MRRSNRMKRIMCEQWVHFLPSYARTETMRFSPRVSRGTSPERRARSTGDVLEHVRELHAGPLGDDGY